MNDIDVPWSARKVLKKLKHDGNAADRVQVAEARATDAER